jgi:membrane protein YdbS with pleckstrin-like domain
VVSPAAGATPGVTSPGVSPGTPTVSAKPVWILPAIIAITLLGLIVIAIVIYPLLRRRGGVVNKHNALT